MSRSSSSEPKSSLSKRKAIREKRRQQQRRQRVTVVVIIAGVVVLLVAVLALPSLLNAASPVGNIIKITPTPHPNPDGRALGPANSPVTVEAFEDFQCPVCRQFSETIEHQIIDNYVATDKIRYIFRQFPFIDSQSITKESHQAANASMCAAEQGRFWDYHDMLFANWIGENQGSFTNKRLVAFAEALGLDMTKFNTCFDNNTYKSEIDSDVARAQSLGVSGTPTIFVNGQRVGSNPQAVPTYEEIAAAIDAALAASGK